MKRLFIICICIFGFQNIMYCQLDTIYTLKKIIPCNVVELGTFEIKYQKPNNKILNIVLPNCEINKIKFSNGEVTIFDSTLYIEDKRIDTNHIVYTFLEKETEGLKYIGEINCEVPSTYSYNIYNRPKFNNKEQINAIANYYGADLIYFPENAFSNYIDETGNYHYFVTTKFYTTELRDFSLIKNIINTNKKYKCKVVSKTLNVDGYIVKDTTDYSLIIDSVQIKNNRCKLIGKIKKNLSNFKREMDVIYFDGDKLYATFKFSNEINSKLILYYIQ